jgi:Ca2+-binding RTX toxin-like protein
MAVLTVGAYGVDFDLLDLAALNQAQVLLRSDTSFILYNGVERATLGGVDFVYGATGMPTSGMITSFSSSVDGAPVYDLSNVNVLTSTLLSWVGAGANETAKATVLAGSDQFVGSAVADHMLGYAGDDTINGAAGDDVLVGGFGADRVFGDDGNDTISDTTGSNYLRGGAGDDMIMGGDGFDDAHGNVGNDTVHGGGADDWSVGGQGNDVLFGDEGGDLVYGNLGDDTVDGGTGDDGVVGGQGNDVLLGGDGADYLTGDRGNDTLTGGAGADRFHFSSISGSDRVTDFNFAEGDRILIDAGLTYTAVDGGADTILNITGGVQVVLVGVSLSAFTADAVIIG